MIEKRYVVKHYSTMTELEEGLNEFAKEDWDISKIHFGEDGYLVIFVIRD